LEISSGIPFALIAAIGWGIWMVLIKFPVSELGPYLTSFIIEGGALVIAFLTLKRSNEELKVSDKKVFLYIIPISILMTIWSISYYQGIKISDISVIVAISSASPFVVTLFGKIFYKEELAFKQYLAIALIISGIILISLK
jgi:uncharacterized membrane protein